MIDNQGGKMYHEELIAIVAYDSKGTRWRPGCGTNVAGPQRDYPFAETSFA